MTQKRTYEFNYNLPADNDRYRSSELFIPAVAEWNKGEMDSNGKPKITYHGPVIEKLWPNHLLRVIDWLKVYADIERIGQEYFSENFVVEKSRSCVAIAEEVLQ